ncbi:MAG: glycoside hydrolase 43 family protein [Kiritimatiellia bacterium]
MINAILLLAATYANPILHLDFSDPDVCIGGDGRAYMTASSFGGLPGLPILASEDLVNWSYVAYALSAHPFAADDPQHGKGVWAPSIRYRADRGEYVIYWGDPDRGIYRVAAQRPEGPWGEPRLVVAGRGLIDPCPLYDDDGRVYLVNAWAASRAGMNSVLTVRELDAEETQPIGDPVLAYDGIPQGNFTAEGPKFYKKDGEYWLFFPAGGVETGWQVAARAQSPFGPYATKTVLAQGKTEVNGPHQGAAVNLRWRRENGRLAEGADSWHFVHFRDKGAYGRIVYLEPMVWERGAWPVIGNAGEPVATARIPGGRTAQLPFGGLQVSDEFSALGPGPQWQFLGKSADLAAWGSPEGCFRLYSTAICTGGECAGGGRNLWNTPNLMVQKFPAEAFTATLKARVSAKEDAEEAGLIVQGRSYARLGLRFNAQQPAFEVVYVECRDADRGGAESSPQVLGTLPPQVTPAGLRAVSSADVRLRLSVVRGTSPEGGIVPNCTFAWSPDGVAWQPCPVTFPAANGKWIGATFGIYAICEPGVQDRGWIDADWLRVE